MLKEKWLFAVSILLILLGVSFSTLVLRRDTTGRFDTVAVNRIVKYAENNWDQFDAGDNTGLAYPYSVLDKYGDLIYQSDKDTAGSINEAVKHQNLIMDVISGNKYLGKVLINTQLQAHLQQQVHRLSGIIITAFSLLALIILMFFLHLNHKVLNPFHKMKVFAQNIAIGNLDAPLAMDRNNLFGPFTESFDIMREELARARYQEAMANKSKKELVASLSHDIKTPLTSIKLISELLEVTTPEPAKKDKIHTIYEKADQIEQLINNLFQASLEELGQLSVTVSEEESSVLEDMIRGADLYGNISMNRVPGCIIRIDPLRMQQVLDNLINNSVKYAGTSMDITFSLADSFLKVVIRDYGPGVPEDELPLLFQKYYRGSKALLDHKDGSGIGLYLCSYLMEQMGGEITCYNHNDGFTSQLLILLA